MFDRDAYHKRMEWYLHDRFGMFIHWGLYAIPARGEWVRSVEEITKEDYMQYFEDSIPLIMTQNRGQSRQRGRNEICGAHRQAS